MNVSSVASSSAYAADATSRVEAAGKRATERTAERRESAKVQLSSVSQVKSATANVESAATALKSPKNLDSLDKVQKAVGEFTKSYVDQQKASAKVAEANPNLKGAGNELRRSLEGTGGANEAALRKIGITVDRQGGIKVDSKALEKAYQANPSEVTDTLNKIGQDVSQAANKQLADNGSVGSSYNRLSQRVDNLDQKQSDIQARLEQSRQTVDERNRQLQQAQANSGIAQSAISAYRGVFSF